MSTAPPTNHEITDDGLLKLRDEIQGFEKATFELQKWKLISIGAALTVGLGLSKEAGSSSFLALLAVPSPQWSLQNRPVVRAKQANGYGPGLSSFILSRPV